MNLKSAWVLAVGFCALTVFGRHAPIESTLRDTDAIACVEVTGIQETEKAGLVTSHATLSIVGNSFGVQTASPFEVEFGLPAKRGVYRVSSDTPFFKIGQKSIVLLRNDAQGVRVLRQILLDRNGKIAEPEVFRAIGFDLGADSAFALECLIKVKREMQARAK